MPLNRDKLLSAKIPAVEHSFGPKDVMLYALALGFGQDPTDENELQFVYEKNLKALPTWPLLQGYDPYWLMDGDYGVTFAQAVHGEQGIVLHAPVATLGTVIGQERVTDVVDKGEGKGALIYSEREIIDKPTGQLLATLTQTVFCRADGGFGGPREHSGPRPQRVVSTRPPDIVCDLATRPDMTLLYRLSGDVNPLHADSEAAKAAGFPRPILHGLATMGVACRAMLKTVCSYNPARITALSCRFSAPVFPGETIRTEIWRDGGVVSFRARVMERDVIAINNGRAEING